MDLLVYLASRPGEVVSADELINSVWHGRVVGDNSVYQCVNELRQALGDSRSDASFIETIRKRGYRLVASVKPIVPQHAHLARKWKYSFAILGISVMILAPLAVRYFVDERGSVPSNFAATAPIKPEQTNTVNLPTRLVAAQAFYHRSRGGSTYDSRRSDLNRAIELDSEFALAYSERASMAVGPLIGVEANTTAAEALELEQIVAEDARRALRIDPTLGRAHAAQAILYQANWRGAEAEQAFQRAIEMSPNDVRVLWQYGEFKRFRGEYEEAIYLGQRAIEADPNDLDARVELGITHRFAGNWDAAAAVFHEVLNLNAASLGEFGLIIQLAYVEASRGNISEAVRRLRVAERLGPLPVYRLAQMAHTYALAGFPHDAARIFAEFEEQATRENIGDGWWAYAHVAVSDYAKSLQRIESAVSRRVDTDQVALLMLAANPWRDPELNKPEFRLLLDHLWLDE